MKRREFMAFVGSMAAWPRAGLAQQHATLKRIGILLSGREDDPDYQARVAAFVEGLRGHGWSDRQNIEIQVRWASGDPQSIGRHANELSGIRPDVLFCNGSAVTAALQKETQSIPIIFAMVSDPVGDGFAASLARPGGNISGFSTHNPEIGGKWLELLKEVAAKTERVGLLYNPKTAAGAGSLFWQPVFETAARSFGIKAVVTPVNDRTEIDEKITDLAKEPRSGLLVMPDFFSIVHRKPIVEAANRNRLPAIYPFRVFANAGGLMVYGVDTIDLNRRAASYVDRVLRGEKPSDLPVQQPTKFELVINLKTAKALDITVPSTLLARADEVIE